MNRIPDSRDSLIIPFSQIRKVLKLPGYIFLHKNNNILKTLLNTVNALICFLTDTLDLHNRLGRTCCQITDLICHNRETSARLSRSGRLNGSVQGKQIGLSRNIQYLGCHFIDSA